MTNGITEATAGGGAFGSEGSARQVLSASGATGTRTATSNTTQPAFVGYSIAIRGASTAAPTINPHMTSQYGGYF
jgi:hypothetical protein